MNLFRTKSIEELRHSADVDQRQLAKVLTAKDVVMLGVGAIIGAGIFSNIGNAAAHAGPALVLSFVMTGIVCALSGLCYAELTAMIPVSGSAYTYAFATMGEFIAWIIGWDLILEYAIGNVAVAISWGNYFDQVLRNPSIGIELPYWLVHGWGDVSQKLAAASDAASRAEIQAYIDAAPAPFGHPLMINLPAALIVLVITWLLVRGVRESSTVNNVMVAIKLAVLALFLWVGFQHVDLDNMKPFAPNGFGGIHAGAAAIFFAYIGFDAVSTAAEETKNPKRDMPIGILGSLALCTVIYVAVGFVATAAVDYRKLQTADPLATALSEMGEHGAELIVAIGACISMTAVLLVFQLGQPRIFFAMSRDGLLPKVFSRVHPKYKTPHVTTILTGLVVAVCASLMDDDVTFDLTSIGTLFAFVVASLGVLVLRVTKPDQPRPFKVPFVWFVAPLAAASCIYTMFGLSKESWERFGIWLAAGFVIYFVRKLTLRPAAPA